MPIPVEEAQPASRSLASTAFDVVKSYVHIVPSWKYYTEDEGIGIDESKDLFAPFKRYGDKGGAFRPSGVRLGSPAITTRGMKEPEMKQIANWMKQVLELCKKAKSEAGLSDKNIKQELAKIHQAVIDLSRKFPVPAIKNKTI